MRTVHEDFLSSIHLTAAWRDTLYFKAILNTLAVSDIDSALNTEKLW